jgi:hypothetical protein
MNTTADVYTYIWLFHCDELTSECTDMNATAEVCTYVSSLQLLSLHVALVSSSHVQNYQVIASTEVPAGVAAGEK